jgi:hypothetical protein
MQFWFERREPNVKPFFEEAIPIGLLGLHLHRPGALIRVACKLGKQPFDAVMCIETPSQREKFQVEVTAVEDRDSAWRREALARQGFCPAWGPLRKEGGEIRAEVAMEDLDERWEMRIDMALDRARKKVEKAPPYEPGTAIVVYSEELRPPDAWWREELACRTRQAESDLVRWFARLRGSMKAHLAKANTGQATDRSEKATSKRVLGPPGRNARTVAARRQRSASTTWCRRSEFEAQAAKLDADQGKRVAEVALGLAPS